MPIKVTPVCDICESEDGVCAYTITPDDGPPWRSFLCATHVKPMQKYQAKGTPAAQADSRSSRTAPLDRMVRNVPRLDHPDGRSGRES